MRQDDIRRWLMFEPFSPFRLHITGGESFEIRDPNQLYLEGLTLWIASGKPLPHRDTMVALRHITHVEPIE